MIRGDVADEGADDFVVTHAAMQPAEKQHELHAGGNDAVKMPYQCVGMRVLLECSGLARFSSSKQVSTCKRSKFPPISEYATSLRSAVRFSPALGSAWFDARRFARALF